MVRRPSSLPRGAWHAPALALLAILALAKPATAGSDGNTALGAIRAIERRVVLVNNR